MMRRFHLVRHDDPSGVSGTGIVAEGVQFTDRRVSIRWFGDHPSTVDWDSLEDAMAVHGHGGKTIHRWLDPQHQAFVTPYRNPIGSHVAAMDRARHPEDYSTREEILHTPEEWQQIRGVRILDPDGWRESGSPAWNQPISEVEFDRRLARCSINHQPNSEG